jgi:hypothetical protein
VIRSLTVEIQKLDVAGWVVTGYFVSYAISMTFMGRVSDLSGRRLVYLSCLVIFFVGSWLVAASPGWPAAIASRIMKGFQTDVPDPAFAPLYALIFGRVVQAFGAGAMVPVSMALVADLFPPEKRALPLGIVGAVDTAGLGARAPLRRDHGAVHDLAVPVLDQPADHCRHVRRHLVWTGRLAAHRNRGPHRLDRCRTSSVSLWCCSMSASARRRSLPK